VSTGEQKRHPRRLLARPLRPQPPEPHHHGPRNRASAGSASPRSMRTCTPPPPAGRLIFQTASPPWRSSSANGGRPTVPTEEVIRADRDFLPRPLHNLDRKLLGVSEARLGRPLVPAEGCRSLQSVSRTAASGTRPWPTLARDRRRWRKRDPTPMEWEPTAELPAIAAEIRSQRTSRHHQPRGVIEITPALMAYGPEGALGHLGKQTARSV
jgi:hypothetical protein